MTEKTLSTITVLEFAALSEHARERMIEREIATRTIQAFIDAGYPMSVDSGGDEFDIEASKDLEAILEHMFAVDECHLMVHRKVEATAFAWVRFIYGNGDNGTVVISDYTTNLEELLAPVNAFARSMDPSEVK